MLSTSTLLTSMFVIVDDPNVAVSFGPLGGLTAEKCPQAWESPVQLQGFDHPESTGNWSHVALAANVI